jgi:hypothetical protein
MPNTTDKLYAVNAATLQRFMDYMSNRPYGEVFQLVNELVGLVREQDAAQVAQLSREANPDTTSSNT